MRTENIARWSAFLEKCTLAETYSNGNLRIRATDPDGVDHHIPADIAEALGLTEGGKLKKGVIAA